MMGTMDTTILGRTGLSVSVAVLGAGGNSRLGLRRGASEAEAADLVRFALDREISFVDTAPAYGTEHVVGAGLAGRRDGVVVSTKLRCTVAGSSYDGSDFIEPQQAVESVEASLRNLRTDRLDILHIHGVRPHQYDFCVNELMPVLQRLRDEGKIRFTGITEGFGGDAEHEVMQRAIADGVWDVLMLGYNFVNPSAARHVLPKAREQNLGVMAMYAVRGALAARATLDALIADLIARGEAPAEAANTPELLLGDGIAASLTEAAYRFCRHSPGIDVVMTGTGSRRHLEENIAAINGPPLPQPILDSLSRAFANVTSATGDL